MTNFDSVPHALRVKPNWLVWRMTPQAGGKARKVPFYSSGVTRSGTQGSDEDRAQLVTFDKAVEACRRGQYSGIGFAVLPDCGVVALDFDDVVVDGKVRADVLRVVAGTYAELSPSGTGVRAFFTGSMASRKDLEGDPKIEVFGTNGFVTFTGNVLPEHDMLDWVQVVGVTPACAEFLAERFGDMSSSGGAVVDLFATLRPKLGLDVERVREVLAKLPKDLPYDDWVRVLMTVHHELGDEGYAVVLEWSKTSPKFTTEKYLHDRWRSFGRYVGGEQLTFAWTLKQAGESAVKESVDAVRGYRQMIADCGDEFHLRTRVAGTIANDQRLQSIDRATLAQSMQDRFAALGIKLPLAELRKLLAAPKRARVDSLPPWAQDYCYVTADDKFLQVGTEATMTKQGFDAKFNREMPRDENGNVMRAASTAVLEDWGMTVVDRALYVPWGDEYFTHAGMSCVNRYRPSSTPVAADSTEGIEKAVIEHLMHVCGQREHVVRLLIQWMAHNVQRPGVKVRWAPVIKGVEGDGKSVIGKVLTATMGSANVRQISPKVIGTDFSGWAEGGCVGILEEIKLTGHNRHDIMNALKPYLTNDDVEIHRKGKDTYTAHNTQNYIAFTNHSDALPINDNDRRWMVIFTPWMHFSEFEKVVGNTDDYFEKLHEVIHSGAAKLRRWLLDIDLENFKANGRAPMTDEKAEMIALSVSEEEDTLRGLIEMGGKGFSKLVVSTSNIASSLRAAGLNLKTRQLSNLLTNVGMVKVVERVWWDGATHRVWIASNLQKDPDSIRKLLDQTTVQDLF